MPNGGNQEYRRVKGKGLLHRAHCTQFARQTKCNARNRTWRAVKLFYSIDAECVPSLGVGKRQVAPDITPTQKPDRQ